MQPELRGEVVDAAAIGQARADVLGDHRRDLWLAPPVRPLARATASPALVRSEIRARSNSAKASMIWLIRRPAGVVVSVASVRPLKPTPRAWRSSNRASRCESERARPSSFQTASVWPGF
jgi:hypothetical protein